MPMAFSEVPFCQASLHGFCRQTHLTAWGFGDVFSMDVAVCGGAAVPVSVLLLSVGSWLWRAPQKGKPQAVRRGLVATSSICACETSPGTVLMGWERAPTQALGLPSAFLSAF